MFQMGKLNRGEAEGYDVKSSCGGGWSRVKVAECLTQMGENSGEGI